LSLFIDLLTDTVQPLSRYQTSLSQFITLFTNAMVASEKGTTAAARVNKILHTLTYMAYRSTNRGKKGGEGRKKGGRKGGRREEEDFDTQYNVLD
jgi:hypothetical protein